ncbi:TetR/AcrR family transcriptional regulator [Kibdelosporangium aridum]|uniref:TetR/AcrR family transcriptional regulator n=1 Tax=Kibdelosporangium aridum TaxID=2030 RepID=UPI0021AE0B7C|nr:TetR/AcrR family transcriptional regulator [Kibdelosporangium aridum]
MPDDELLKIGATPPKERADAARNREKILEAAAKLFEKYGVTRVSMDQVAVEARVGKGTVFRRFGDKSGLAVALLDDRERELQQAILSGPPPLGPDAPADARLIAFVEAYAAFLDANVDLIHVSETASPGARYRIGSYQLWHRHVTILLAKARPDLDADYLAHAILAPLSADLHKALDYPSERAAAGAVSLTRLVLTGVTSGP